MRAFLGLLLFLASGAYASTPAPQCKRTRAPTFHDLAPADEYFGKLGMSILGMNNYLTDYGYTAADPNRSPEDKEAALEAGADNVSEAIEAMNKRYPLEPSTPKYLFRLAHLYLQIGTPTALQRYTDVSSELANRCPNSPSGQQMRDELDQRTN